MAPAVIQTEEPEPLALMPRFVAVTPDEMRAARRIASRLRASCRICSEVEKGSHANAARLVAGVSLPAGDLFYLLNWLDHMAGN